MIVSGLSILPQTERVKGNTEKESYFSIDIWVGEYYGAQPYWRNIQAWHISEHSVNDLVNITSLGSVQLMGNIIYTVIVCIGNINTFKLSFFLLKPTFIQHFESCWWLSECEVRPAVWTIEMEMRDDADMNIEKTNQKLFVLFRI